MIKKHTRREFAKKSINTSVAVAAITSAPTVFARKKYQIRVIGTHITLQEEIRLMAEKELGISILFQPGSSAKVLHRASTKPESFDIYEQWSNSISALWQAKAIQPIETKRIRYWKDVSPLTKEGKLTKDSQLGAGDAPFKILYTQKDNSLSSAESDHISFVPYAHNADSFGYNSANIPRGEPYRTESWGWLLNSDYKGKVALVNAPTIGIFDAALAARANGLMSFQDIGDMTRTEIDRLFKILNNFKREGQFRGVWGSVHQSVKFMERGEVDIQSMFSPGVSALNADGIACVYAAPREGYRAWHGAMCLSTKTSGATKDAAYEYMNWWLSGWPGAFIARQGYYISTPKLAKKFLSKEEWDYWYEGKPAAKDLTGTDGKIIVTAGTSRNGGSYHKRFSKVAVWNTVMSNYEYTLAKWGEFLLT